MPRTFAVSIISLGAVVLLAHSASAQPRISNGQVASQPAGASFGDTFRSAVAAQADVGWIGYAVPVVATKVLGAIFFAGTAVLSSVLLYPLVICGACIITSIIGTFFVKLGSNGSIMGAL